jgi:hypothetical protein
MANKRMVQKHDTHGMTPFVDINMGGVVALIKVL